MQRIEVKYVPESMNYAEAAGGSRWLDLGTMKLYLGSTGFMLAVEATFAPDGTNRWKSPSGRAIIEAVQPIEDLAPAAQSDRGAGLKADAGKGRWTLLMQGFPLALAGVVEVLGFGAKKYAAHSWRQVENAPERYRDALYRHLNALESGELVDPESGLSHWEHICFNALALNELSKAVPDGV